MKIRDIMRPGAFTIGETDCLGNAYSAMTRSHIRHLPVTAGGRLVGILSERDVLAARARADEADWWALPVANAMQAPVQFASPDDSVTEVAGRMAAAKIGAMPVVDRGRLLGLATVTDVLDAEVRMAMAPAPRRALIAADAMTPWPFTIGPDAALYDAVALMVNRHIRHVPVVDSASNVVGMVSERDVRSAIGDPRTYVERRSPSEAQYRVADVMARPAAVVPFDRSIDVLAETFADGAMGALPVVDKFGALIGIISYVDVLKALAA
jgi:CBS domain-containing protein